jgi:hypothetical protein
VGSGGEWRNDLISDDQDVKIQDDCRQTKDKEKDKQDTEQGQGTARDTCHQKPYLRQRIVGATATVEAHLKSPINRLPWGCAAVIITICILSPEEASVFANCNMHIANTLSLRGALTVVQSCFHRYYIS